MTHWSLLGRRILGIGPDLAPLARGALFGAALEIGDLSRLADLLPGSLDLLLIDADSLAPDQLASALTENADSLPPVLLLGQSLDTRLVRCLMRLPLSDVLTAPYDDAQLQAAIYGLLDGAFSVPAAPAGNRRSQVLAVMGAVGGAGATTLAIEMAAALAGRSEGRVCLIDLNLADGAAPAYLGAPAAMSLADFGNAADRIDAALLAAFASPVSSGLDLLASPRSPRGFEQISREAVLKVLDIASESYGTVVIDLPRHRQAWTLDIVSGADEVVVISELTVPALISARDLCQELEADCPAGLRVRLVLNRLATRLFGPAPSMAEAERAVGRRADGGITSDWESAAASVNLGGPIRQHRPRSRIVRDVEALLARLNLGQAGFRSAA